MEFTVKEYTVPFMPPSDNMRLDAWLAGASGFSRAKIKELILAGFISFEGTLVLSPSRRVRHDEVYILKIPPDAPSDVVAEDIPLDVIHEDPEILVINKPPGLVVHPAAGHESGTLANALIHFCPEVSNAGFEERPGIVHRLDKDTSGIMVVAKTPAAYEHLTTAFHDDLVEKVYKTIVHGVPSAAEGRVETLIGRHPVNRKKMAVVTTNGKNAISNYSVLESFRNHALMSVIIETGRTHQIRVHMQHLGCPVVGDPVYGRRKSDAIMAVKPQRQMLHAWRLGFSHPSTGEMVLFEAPAPQDFTQVLSCLREQEKSG
jgi:23S rRNA pseudouridine1911/1915/1917 synthase